MNREEANIGSQTGSAHESLHEHPIDCIRDHISWVWCSSFTDGIRPSDYATLRIKIGQILALSMRDPVAPAAVSYTPVDGSVRRLVRAPIGARLALSGPVPYAKWRAPGPGPGGVGKYSTIIVSRRR
jgi:hypothetical protein